jgi:hypothetical protein
MAGIPNPPWWLTNRAVSFGVVSLGMLLIAYGFYRQTISETTEAVRRLHHKTYVTFREIAATLPEAHPAYSKEDIYTCLSKAVMNREFESYSGHSRIRRTDRGIDGIDRTTRPIVDGVDYVRTALCLPDNASINQALYNDAIGKYVDSTVGALTFEQTDFARWYSRFQRHCYEN